MARRSAHLLQDFGWEVFNHHPPYSPDLVASDFLLFLHPKKFLSGQRQRFQNDREAEMSVTVVPIPGSTLLRLRYKSWSYGLTNVSISEVNMLKNNSALAVSVPINHIKLGFISVNGPRETYFVDVFRVCIQSPTSQLTPSNPF